MLHQIKINQMNYQKKLAQYQLDIKKIQLLPQKAFGLQMCEGIF